MKRSLRSYPTLLLVLLLGGICISSAEAQDTTGTDVQHVLLQASEITWQPATGLPPGAEIAVIEGNPAEAGPFTLRVRMPNDYRIAPHWHPGIEHVTVLSGTFNVGMGGEVDTNAATALTAGGFTVMPPKTPHFAWTTEETTLQLHGMGPWGITYVNPADDPRAKAQ